MVRYWSLPVARSCKHADVAAKPGELDGFGTRAGSEDDEVLAASIPSGIGVSSAMVLSPFVSICFLWMHAS